MLNSYTAELHPQPLISLSLVLTADVWLVWNCVDQTSLEFTAILMPLPPEYWE